MTMTAKRVWVALVMGLTLSTHVLAEWRFSGGDMPNAFIQTDKMTLALQCDRIRFAPAGYEDSQDIAKKQGLSIRFMKNGSTEVGAFQAGDKNASIKIVDNYPIEVVFNDVSDYQFVQDQISKNAVLKLSMIDQDVSYGIFDLKGSTAALRSLKTACATSAAANKPMEAPEGVVYCGGGGIKRMIEYIILDRAKVTDEWDARVTVNGETKKAMTSYSFFGKANPPKGFVVALLGEDRSEFLIFKDGKKNWLEFGDYQYDQCN